ncbi:MAG: hypothetical protein II005_10340, partial [Turicibacter sp.]|nr:hypothetical protein [Turicibacter sp.]
MKEFYLDKGVFAKVLHDPEDRREYIDMGDAHIKHYFSSINEDMLEDNHIDNISKSFDESKIYQINKREYEHVYYNLYYDNFTNEEEYYGCRKSIYERLEYDVEEAEDVDVSWKDSKTLYVPFMEMNEYFEMTEGSDKLTKKSHTINDILERLLGPEGRVNGLDNELSDDSDIDVKLSHFKGAYVLSGKEIKEIIEKLKSLRGITRIKTYSISVIEEDVKRYYRFIDVDDERKYYNKHDLENDYMMGIFVNKDNPDPVIREKARNFAKICFAYKLYRFNHNYLYDILEYLTCLYSKHKPSQF